MSIHEEMAQLNADQHPLVSTIQHESVEGYLMGLMKSYAYEIAVRLGKNKTVLDLGCNDGYGTQLLSTSATKTVGVDISEKAIVEAKGRFVKDNIAFYLADGVQLPFADDQFDLIVSFQVIEHVGDCSGYLSEIKRVLKATGQAIFTTPNSVIRLDIGMKPWNRFHVREYNCSELKSELGAFFPYVAVRGLFAEGEFYSIIINRMERSRDKARIQQRKQRRALWKLIKKAIPKIVFIKLNAVRSRFKKAPARNTLTNNKSNNFKNNFSTDQLSYRSDNLDEGMNLIAICANDERAFKELENALDSSKL